MIIRNRAGGIIGVVKNDVLIKKVDSRIHKLKIVDGYGIDLRAFQKAQDAGVKSIRIVEIDTGRVFESSLKNFSDKSIEVNLGYGKQLALAGCYWDADTMQDRLL